MIWIALSSSVILQNAYILREFLSAWPRWVPELTGASGLAGDLQFN